MFRRKIGNAWLLLFFITISQVLECFCCVLSIPDKVYRLLFVRYFFLLYLGYLLAIEGLKINKVTLLVSLVSLCCLVEFRYVDFNLRPFFYTGTDGWRTCHWICYFYMCYGLLYVIHLSYIKVLKTDYKTLSWIRSCILKVGQCSYQIFLIQMLYFSVFSWKLNSMFSMLGNKWFQTTLYIVFSMFICVYPLIMYRKLKSSIFSKLHSLC